MKVEFIGKFAFIALIATCFASPCATFYTQVAQLAGFNLAGLQVGCHFGKTQSSGGVILIDTQQLCRFKNYLQAAFPLFHEICHIVNASEDENKANECALKLLKRAFPFETLHLSSKLNHTNFYHHLSAFPLLNNSLQRSLSSLKIALCF